MNVDTHNMLQPLTCLLLCGALALPGTTPLFAQCAGLEVPNNGIDEDCDGLDDLYLHLPQHIYLAAGQPFELFFRNVILSQHPADYGFTVTTALPGTTLPDRWICTPSADFTAGVYPLELTVQTPQGLTLATAQTVVHVSSATPPADTSAKRIVLLGHSFFDQGYLPFFLQQFLTQNPNPAVSFHGKRSNWIDNGIRFEAIGGASWEYYANTAASPLYYDGTLDLRQYFDEVIGPGLNPDWIIIHLDINDFCFMGQLDGSSLPAIDNYIDWVHETRSRKLIDSLRATAPDLKIGIAYTPPPSADQAIFNTGFGAGDVLANPWRWRKIVSRLLFKNEAFFGNREAENIFLLPVHLDLNDSTDFSATDPVHPQAVPGDLSGPSGYRRMARGFYGWLRYLLNNPAPLSTPTPAADEVLFSVYPNPSSGEIFVKTSGNGPAQLAVFNSQGQAVERKEILLYDDAPAAVALAPAPPGLYALEIRLADGRRVVRRLLRK